MCRNSNMEDSMDGYSGFFNCYGFCNCFHSWDASKKKNTEIEIVPKPPEDEVPYHGKLPNKLEVGSVIYVDGIVKPFCSRFSINLSCSELLDENADLALHFNPRFEQRYVVRTSRQNGRWGAEETAGVRPFPFKRGDQFHITFVMTDEEIYIATDDEHFCAFVHRIPLRRINSIEVHGNVVVNKIDFSQTRTYPESKVSKPLLVIPISEPTIDENSTVMMPNPCVCKLDGGLPIGHQLDIQGKVKLLPHSFYVNLQKGSSLWPHPIIPLHLNPRFSTSMGAHAVVRNSWIDGDWGTEERAPGFQFIPGHPFCLTIRCEDNQYSVWVDGQLTAIFNFRAPPSLVDTVYIQGDVHIKKIIHSDKMHELYFNPKFKEDNNI